MPNSGRRVKRNNAPEVLVAGLSVARREPGAAIAVVASGGE